ncbi:MAG: hypothetical protein QM778_00180 [Myxococcales bacterium]
MKQVDWKAAELAELGRLVRALVQDSSRGPNTLTRQSIASPGAVSIEWRHSGRFLGTAWLVAPSQLSALAQIIDRARPSLQAANELLLCLAYTPRTVALGDDHDWQQLTANLRRGLEAYELEMSGQPQTVKFVNPFAIVAQNRPIERQLLHYAQQYGFTLPQARAGQLMVRVYDTQQFFIDLYRSKAAAVPLYRTQEIVPLSTINRSQIERLRNLWGEYLIRSVQADGRMSYLFYPSRGTEDLQRNNAIRQWMATRALIAWWRETQSEQVLVILRRNLDYNLRAMYREEGNLGLIRDGEKIKLAQSS